MGEELIILRATNGEGKSLQAHFDPSKGMNLISYKKEGIEAIDQSTRPFFEERYAGLGALIGPHFHHRQKVPPVENETLYPHIAVQKARGVNEPFSHGVGRYAPWKIEAVSEKSVQAILRGKDEWKGVSLESLEGQDFTMRYKANLLPQGLLIDFSVVSDTGSVVGLHTYYALNGKGGNGTNESSQKSKVIAQVKERYNDKGEIKPIPSSWNYNHNHTMIFDMQEEWDYGFFPFPDSLKGSITLEAPTHKLRVEYECENEENSWQLWHPKGVSFVCIEPLSAKNPRKPHLSVSQLQILISIL